MLRKPVSVEEACWCLGRLLMLRKPVDVEETC